MHPGGAQAIFNIKADIGTYGKVIGGGLPIGVIAGKKDLMDALDGGQWQYGDDSIPEVGVTYFAGTFVRHPLALATAKASLQYMAAKGPELQTSINKKAEYLATRLNAELEQRQLPFYIAQFGSLWKTKFKEDTPCYELMFTLMREKGIHIWDGFPCFMTEAHTKEDVEKIISVFIDSVDEIIAAGFYKKVLHKSNGNNKSDFITADKIHSPGAKLGRDKSGNPAWFISDPEQPGKYLQIKTR
jgi:glutamate-1-semialdehyde aminotransferase